MREAGTATVASNQDSRGTASTETEHAWLAFGAPDKAESVIRLTSGLSIDTVLEIGSGTGALLGQLDRRAFGRAYYALEPSAAMHRYMTEVTKPSRLVDAEAATLDRSRFRHERFDLAILSHVLEHVADPARLLTEAMAVAGHVVVEVPLDGSPLGNVRARLRTRLTGVPRHNNASGHIQFFSTRGVHDLVRWCGGEIVGSRLYSPRQGLRQPTGVSLPGRLYFETMKLLRALVGKERWARLYHGHYAVLVRRAPAVPASERTRWVDVYYQQGQEDRDQREGLSGR